MSIKRSGIAIAALMSGVVVLTFVIGFYLLRDGEAIRSRLRNLLPANLRAKYDFATDALAFVVGVYVFFTPLSQLSWVLWISLMALFVHQFEEYRYPGYFPGMVNLVLFASNQPDRYPLNANTALIVNVIVGWLFYWLAFVATYPHPNPLP